MATDDRRKTKTETVWERSIRVYLPSHEMKNRWTKIADERGQSFSKFIIEMVNDSIDCEKENPSMETRVKLIEDKRKLQEQNRELLRKIREQDSHIEMLEKEARRHVTEPYLDQTFERARDFNTNLINLFKKEREIPKEEIYKKLRIDPMDSDATTAIQKQIEIFEQYGFLKDIGGKWRWKL